MEDLNKPGDEGFFYEAGIKFGNQYFSMIFPVYISDPAPKEDNIDFRFFFSYYIPLP